MSKGEKKKLSDKELQRTVLSITSWCFEILTCIIIFKAVSVIVTLVSGHKFTTLSVIDAVMLIGAIVSTLTLVWIRKYDIIKPGYLFVHRLNRLRTIANIVILSTYGILGTNVPILLVVYMFVFIMAFIMDLMYSLMITIAPKFCNRHFKLSYVRLSSLTEGCYIRCIVIEYCAYVLSKEGKNVS